VRQVSPATTERLVSTEFLERLVCAATCPQSWCPMLAAVSAHAVLLDLPDLLATMDNPANPEDLATAARQAIQATPVLKVLLARTDLPAQLVRVVSLAAKVATARKAPRARLDLREHLVTLDRKDSPDHPATPATKAVLDVLARVARLEHLDSLETPAHKARLDHRAHPAKTRSTVLARLAARTCRKAQSSFCRQHIVTHRKPMHTE